MQKSHFDFLLCDAVELDIELPLIKVKMNFLLILETVFRCRAVLHFGQVLHLLELLEFLVVSDMCVVGSKTHEIVH